MGKSFWFTLQLSFAPVSPFTFLIWYLIFKSYEHVWKLKGRVTSNLFAFPTSPQMSPSLCIFCIKCVLIKQKWGWFNEVFISIFVFFLGACIFRAIKFGFDVWNSVSVYAMLVAGDWWLVGRSHSSLARQHEWIYIYIYRGRHLRWQFF